MLHYLQMICMVRNVSKRVIVWSIKYTNYLVKYLIFDSVHFIKFSESTVIYRMCL